MTSGPWLLALVLTTGGGAAHADEPPPDELPPAPEKPVPADPYAPDDAPSFGSDVSALIVAGALLGSWPDGGVHGFGLLRYDAFLASRDEPGYRVGLSLWGGRTLWPRQTFSEEGGPQQEAFDFTQFGAMTVLRGDPETPVTPAAGLGMSMLQLDSYAGGPLTIPMLGLEAGARLHVRKASFVDILARAHWGTTRSLTAASLHEWWMVQLAVGPGIRAR